MGCTDRGPEVESLEPLKDVPMMNSGGRARMASISEGVRPRKKDEEEGEGKTAETQVDASKDSQEDQERYEERNAELGDDVDFGQIAGEGHFGDLQEKDNPLEQRMLSVVQE